MPSIAFGQPPEPLQPPFVPTAPNMLRWIADQYGDLEAQVRGQQRLTFRQLERQSATLARGLLAEGIGKGARVALLMPNGPSFTVAFMAAARIGALVAPLSTLFKPRELGWALRHGDFQLLMTTTNYLGHDYLGRLEETLPSLAGQTARRLWLKEAPYLRSILTWGEGDAPWGVPGVEALTASAENCPAASEELLAAVEANVAPADLLSMILTSGSTAEPKAVVHSHGAMLRVGWQKSHRFWAVGDPGDRLIGPRPQFWVAGLAATLLQTLLKGCCLLDPDDLSAAGVLNLIEKEGATGACGNLPWLKQFAADPALKDAGYEVFITALETAAFARRTADGVRFLNPTRASRAPSPAQAPLERLPHTYGMTETIAGHTSIPAGELLDEERSGYCGRPMPGVRLRLCDPATGEVVEHGEIGEIQVAGYSMMDGLYKRERPEVFTPDGWYRTGDLGVMDAEGYVRFQTRMGEMLKIKGANVSPAEVEACLNVLPGIVRSAVVGLPTPNDDPLLVAVVELRPGQAFDEGAIREALRRQLSSFKVPRRIFELSNDDFQFTASGKVIKRGLDAVVAKLIKAERAP